MLESEMEDLLWMHPDKFLKPLHSSGGNLGRQSDGRTSSLKTRSDAFWWSRSSEACCRRGAIDQVHDYFGGVKNEFPDKHVEMMVIAQSIPQERRMALEWYNNDYCEISEKRFRDVALGVGCMSDSERESTPACLLHATLSLPSRTRQ